MPPPSGREAKTLSDFPFHDPRLVQLLGKGGQAQAQHGAAEGVFGDGEKPRLCRAETVEGERAGPRRWRRLPVEESGAAQRKPVDQPRPLAELRGLGFPEQGLQRFGGEAFKIRRGEKFPPVRGGEKQGALRPGLGGGESRSRPEAGKRARYRNGLAV